MGASAHIAYSHTVEEASVSSSPLVEIVHSYYHHNTLPYNLRKCVPLGDTIHNKAIVAFPGSGWGLVIPSTYPRGRSDSHGRGPHRYHMEFLPPPPRGPASSLFDECPVM